MKKFLLFIFILSNTLIQAQNLVSNPSFEDTIQCPYDIGQINFATGWQSCNEGDPEYYNACSINGYGVPQNSWGNQYAPNPNCKAYCGLYPYNPWSPNNREFIRTQLINPLTIGEKYYCSMKVSLSDFSICASSNFGMLFSTVPTYFGLLGPLNNFSHINNPNIISNKTGWTTVTGSFVADSAYSFLSIGNFFDDAHTDTSCNQGGLTIIPYYFIDDICVSTDSTFSYNFIFTCGSGINQQNLSNVIFNFSPNPATNTINLYWNNSDIKTINCNIYDIYSRRILQLQNMENQHQIDVSVFAEGTYILQMQTDNLTINKKLIIYKP